MGSNDDVNCATRITWNNNKKKHLQGRHLKDRNIKYFFYKKCGPKRSFDTEEGKMHNKEEVM
eukprot:7303041-Ditylum_brightwellii.AAC.1